jgi:hypothetical protein
MTMSEGFIKLRRTAETTELLNDPKAFTLLTVIALRARRTDEFNIHNLKAGEALLGDHERYGLTRQEYRSAQRRLKQWGLAAFKPTTNGTVASLLDQRIYDVNRLERGMIRHAPATPKESTREMVECIEGRAHCEPLGADAVHRARAQRRLAPRGPH